MLTLLLVHGSEIDARDNEGMTALGYAARSGRTATAMLLIQYGADITVTTRFHETLLLRAVQGRSLPLIRYLHEHGLDVNTRTHGGYTALMGAIDAGGTFDVVKYLLEHGADPNIKMTSTGGTALTKAAGRGYPEYVELLLKHGAEVNAEDGSWSPALIDAADDGYTEVARVLLEHGANVHGEVGRDILERHIQGIRCKPEFIELLREYGVEVTDEDRCEERGNI